MNLNKLVSIFDQGEGKTREDKTSFGRRDFFRSAGQYGKKASLAVIPAFALSMFPKHALAQTSSVTDVLNFALTLEYLEDEFYKSALDVSGLIPASDRNIFMQISKHETAHVTLLKTALGTSAVAKPTFDFTAGGAFPDAMSNYMTFLALSQSFEDTG